jgi:tyrosyl-tRNA synthetase
MKIDKSEQKIDVLLTRGVEAVYPSSDYLRSRLNSGEVLKIYLGVDPTGPTLHLGHAITLKKLRDFQELGHKIILLIGDFTATIGDPTGKGETRNQLTHAEVLVNAKLYKEQAETFLRFDGENPAEIKYNSVWFKKMGFENVLDLASKMTVSQMIERDMFQKRMKEGKPIYIHEFLYPLMQGYDSVAMEVDGEVGGNDQTFNMLTGRTLMKQISNKEKFVLAMKLLTDSGGVKMGKTEGNMVALTDSPEEMYGKVMSWNDSMIVPGFELCTDESEAEIEEIKKDKDSRPREVKMKLAKDIVSLYYGKEKAESAQESFINIFSKGGIPEDITEVVVLKGTELKEVLLANGLVSSGSDFRRLMDEGAISVNEDKIEDYKYAISEGVVVKVGKRRFIKIKI